MDLPSLHPYLYPGRTDTYLRFSLAREDPSFLEKSPFPFLVISDSDPLTRMVEARFMTGAGSEIKRIFLLLQKDQYPIAKDELWPITNRDIDESWQKAFTLYAKRGDAHSCITLSPQVDRSGGLAPLQPLFFCKKKRTFFPPPCPECGLPLQQCCDDHILAGMGLQPYTLSLRRYLFCPSCFALKGRADFYAYEREGADPPALKDRADMIRAFGSLREREARPDRFPCLECPENKECFGPPGKAASRMVPFSFYPFYMLIFDAMSLNALDFLPLIGGAGIEEMESRLSKGQETGRASCLKRVKQEGSGKGLLFSGKGGVQFFEVLYLKLSFLGELVRGILSPGLETLAHPDLRISLDRIWVRLPGTCGLLPFLWDFDVGFIDITRGGHDAPHLPLLPQSLQSFLCLVWFYTFLVNRRQEMHVVYRSLNEMIKAFDPARKDPFTDIAALREGFALTFLPENVFWDPEGKEIPQKGTALWERILNAGWSLLSAALTSGPQWSREEFLREIEALREEAKKGLFQGGPEPEEKALPQEEGALPQGESAIPQGEGAIPQGEGAIHEILVRIRDRWRIKIDSEKQVAVKREGKATGIKELEETVVISPSSAHNTSSLPELPKKEKELEETVIISPQKAREGSAAIPQQSLNDKKGEESSQEPKKAQKTQGKSLDADFFTETIILTPDKEKEEETDG